ncbi:adenine deaminase C-terminal domain-containing protein [Streptomyces luteolus]|uniref:Adenine deaminase C-terminal domain-containing protein n=1 Tax=Streptomyces luteolus TaxID=3043615 RepID=A0ABT6SQ98_9ACTN|nr:adenine deaminase C-terminal domain-containing protein [Streptomyces sp. B-S-A12]MDI3417787.1 adenine deaminase C-terminal domain-containing protein [Streptomyces sp. B-S-A12]
MTGARPRSAGPLADEAGWPWPAAARSRRGGGALLPLAVGGAMPTAPARQVAETSRHVRDELGAWGRRHRNPFISVSTLTLAVSPTVKITDLGLVDVLARDWAPQVLDCCH